jgi:hypothetical protein
MRYDYKDITVVRALKDTLWLRALRKQAQQGIRQPNLPDKWALVRPTIDLNPAANIPYGIILPK